MTRTPKDLARELAKVHDTVVAVAEQMWHQAESDAALHMATTVRANPLTVAVIAARVDLGRIIDELMEEPA